MKNALIERAAQLIAHRACCGAEHDPAVGKLHGCCVVCGVPWPCEYAGKPPSPAAKVADARYFEGGQDLSNDPIHVAAVDLQIALLGASEAAHRLTVIARDSEEALAAPASGRAGSTIIMDGSTEGSVELRELQGAVQESLPAATARGNSSPAGVESGPSAPSSKEVIWTTDLARAAMDAKPSTPKEGT